MNTLVVKQSHQCLFEHFPTQVFGKNFPTHIREKDFPTHVHGKDFPTNVRRNCILSIILRTADLGGNGGQTRDRRQSWRQKLPNITGNSGDNGFAAPIDLFVFNVNNDVTEDVFKNHM